MRPQSWLALAPLLLACPGVARAICGSPPPATVLPRFDTPAPRNTHVWVALTNDWKRALLCSPDGPCAVEPALELRSAPTRDRASMLVPVERRASQSGNTTTVELSPRDRLAANAAHEVWLVDRKQQAQPRLLGAFVTTDQIDTTPPSWQGASAGRVLRHSVAARGSGYLRIEEECGNPLASVDVSAATDDLTRPDELRIALWQAGGRGLVLSGPPILYQALPDPRLSADRSSHVLLLGTTETELSDFALDSESPRRLGLRVVDLAGNASRSSVVQLAEAEQGCEPAQTADLVYGCVDKTSITSRRCGEFAKVPPVCECPPGDVVCSAFCARQSKRRIPGWEAPAPGWEAASCGERCKTGHGGSCLRLAGRLFHLGNAERARAFDLAARACELDAKLCDPAARRVCWRYGGCEACGECYR